MSNIKNEAINAIRILSADAIQKANSGHPGLPLGVASVAYELFANHMKHNPKNEKFANRDRFILSGGHGSALLYSLFHLFGYGDLKIEDLKNFRQLGSKTPGHPEYGHTVGVEATTGPLGAGMGMAVGMAMAERHLSEVFNEDDMKIVDHYTYVLGGDGCFMEGISSEAFSLAGTLGLSKLIVLYDSNNISIEGSTDLAFTEDVSKRMESFGFQVLKVEDGNNLEEISKALILAKEEKSKPSFIEIKTVIGYGVPKKQGKASAHGEPLGVENVKELRENLAWKYEEEFFVPDSVYEHYKNIVERLEDTEKEWNVLFEKYSLKYPEKRKLWDEYHQDIDIALLESEDFWNVDIKDDATRNSSGMVLNKLKDVVKNLVGGSADLAPSNKSTMNGSSYFEKNDFSGRNIHFGVRELAMAAATNGINLHGGLRAYCATFFVFSDYVKPMARLSALMGVPSIYIFTHDSIGVGEDGPTHQPIEQLAMFRAMPNFNVYRPADTRETIAAWYSAITQKNTPTALVLTRQNLRQLNSKKEGALKGAYIIRESKKELADMILIASGSELSLCIDAAEILSEKGIDVQVVSMPSSDVFEKQDEAYKESVLPKSIRKRIFVEALSSYGLEKYVGLDGKIIAMESFGESAPFDKLFKKFGFTVENIVEEALKL